jgi:hypothetical protein
MTKEIQMTPNPKLVELHRKVHNDWNGGLCFQLKLQESHSLLTQDIAVKYSRWRDKQGIEGATGFYKWKPDMFSVALEENETPETELFNQFMTQYTETK